MTTSVQVAIHPSQFPENVRRDLLASLRTRRVNHKFHYDSVKQTQKWLALHEAYSPARNDADCLATYDRAFAAAAAQIKARQVHVIGLGCGGGQKDAQLMKQLQARGKKISYTPCDVSVAMVLVARQAALAIAAGGKLFSLRLRSGDGGRFARTLADVPPHAVTRHFLRHDSEFRAAPNPAKTRGAVAPQGFSAVQRQPCAGRRLRRRHEKNSAAIRQSADARLAPDLSVRSRRGTARRRAAFRH